MNEVLDSLSRIPGVRMAVLATDDGVPVAFCGRRAAEPGSDEAMGLRTPEGAHQSVDQAASLAGLAIGWLNDLRRSVGLMSWNSPRRIVLHGARGSMVLLHANNAVLLAFLDRGARCEDLRLPMEGAVGRMQRILRSMGDRPKSRAPYVRKERGEESPAPVEPKSLIPSQEEQSEADVLSLDLDMNPSNNSGPPRQH